jgi:multiple sugar transport system ATP-binding protein
MVFQNYALYPHMTVRQNMEFALKPQKLASSEVSTRITEAARILGLEPLFERKPSQLSGGQRQRVAMGRAMVRTPKVFLFDEPLSNLDATLRTQVRLEIAKLHKRLGTTIIYVTHDQIEAMTLADKIVIMKDGRIEQIGSPEEVFTRPRNLFVASFIGSPAMNLLPAKVGTTEGKPVLVSGSLRFSLPPALASSLNPAQAVMVGIRPTDVRLIDRGDADAYDASIDVVEYLGNEALLNLKVGDQELVAQVPASQRPAHDLQQLHVAFDSNHLHVFDTQSGQAIRA